MDLVSRKLDFLKSFFEKYKIKLSLRFQIGIIHLLYTNILHKMLIINVKEEESIERALKRYKRKVRDTKITKEIRDRKVYIKPSVKRRTEIMGAKYRAEKFG